MILHRIGGLFSGDLFDFGDGEGGGVACVWEEDVDDEFCGAAFVPGAFAGVFDVLLGVEHFDVFGRGGDGWAAVGQEEVVLGDVAHGPRGQYER
ncbi:MAG: hypothetical protein EBU84_10665 [Actinobacteria bacterium]|nr:hypothetical protein [Actinomycetota bacterium]